MTRKRYFKFATIGNIDIDRSMLTGSNEIAENLSAAFSVKISFPRVSVDTLLYSTNSIGLASFFLQPQGPRLCEFYIPVQTARLFITKFTRLFTEEPISVAENT